MFHFDGYTRGNHPDDANKATPRRPVRFFIQERGDLFADLLDTIVTMATQEGTERDRQIKDDLYDVLMTAAGALAEINWSDSCTKD